MKLLIYVIIVVYFGCISYSKKYVMQQNIKFLG